MQYTHTQRKICSLPLYNHLDNHLDTLSSSFLLGSLSLALTHSLSHTLSFLHTLHLALSLHHMLSPLHSHTYTPSLLSPLPSPSPSPSPSCWFAPSFTRTLSPQLPQACHLMPFLSPVHVLALLHPRFLPQNPLQSQAYHLRTAELNHPLQSFLSPTIPSLLVETEAITETQLDS